MKSVISQHIEMRPSAIHGEKACVAGTRIRVEDVYIWHELEGMSPHEIVEQFPRNMLNMEEATHQILENGTLQIRMPYYVMRRPVQYYPASLFQPQDCFVW